MNTSNPSPVLMTLTFSACIFTAETSPFPIPGPDPYG